MSMKIKILLQTDKDTRPNPEMKFLTNHQWSDERIVGLRGKQLYYLSSGANYTHRHLYRFVCLHQVSLYIANYPTSRNICFACSFCVWQVGYFNFGYVGFICMYVKNETS